MRKIGRYIVILITIVCVSPLAAQDEDVLKQSSINDQFDYVIEKSNTYEQFKVVRYRHMMALKKSSLDSISNLKTEINTNEKEINELKATQNELETNLTNVQKELEAVTTSKNSMAFLGQEIEKTLYNSVMWGLIFVLIGLSAILFFLFKRSHAVTKETKERLTEVEEEFEKHRKTALKREQKLARELMDLKVKNNL
ncbi:tRNA (guanine-N1)-methyltransferase [Carboxylicivirga linearis]|uniref:tRNA (Guanine-N1)-methyltransferase n=1 Tax=Carboxylicivirga linearis TaxID=1628157 RepID=A0ABS5JRY5_9BACT|nr:tRNA (guanine-N1)-methyltransferase [Carboxylicivirga linearis]MBS2097668.1 tRNA (guanine-N1)-methyltransferase [Carboxylicivirga linearis]